MSNRLRRLGQSQTYFLLLLVFVLWMAPLSADAIEIQSAKGRVGDLYGGIEISPSGLKGVAIRLTENEDGFRVVYAENINASLAPSKDQKTVSDLIRELLQAVSQVHVRMKTEYRVPENNIYLIGASRLRTGVLPGLLPELSKAIKEKIGKTLVMLDLDTEIQLNVTGTIPPRHRARTGPPDIRDDAALVEIGGDTIRGGYQVIRQNNSDKLDYDYVTFNLPKGLRNVTDEINELTAKDNTLATFIQTAKGVCSTAVGVTLRDEVERKPGLVNRQEVYLSGGIVHAMMTLLRPDDRRLFVRVFEGEIDIFYRTLTGDPDILQRMLFPDLARKVSNPTLRKEIEKQVESVRNTYSIKDLIAGAELLRTVATELKLSGKTVRYARIGHLSSILGYVRTQTSF